MILEVAFTGCCIFQTWYNIKLGIDIDDLKISNETLWGHIHDLHEEHTKTYIFMYKKITELEKKNEKME